MAALATETSNFGRGHAGNAIAFECVLHFIELERFDDCGNEPHVYIMPDMRTLRVGFGRARPARLLLRYGVPSFRQSPLR